MGAAYGTAKSGVAVASLGVMNPALVMKSMIPVVMAGVIGIYGLIVAVIIVGQIPQEVSSPEYCAKIGYAHFGSGESAPFGACAAAESRDDPSVLVAAPAWFHRSSRSQV